jgi:hypothetical protein
MASGLRKIIAKGPGQALIVTPRGEVKPCCGFASDLEQLTIGNIHTDTVEQIVARGRAHSDVGKVFREGLTAIRDEILAHNPDALPGATSNHCFFCWYVLTQGAFDASRANPGDRIGDGGSPWAKLRTALPMVGTAPTGCLVVLVDRYSSPMQKPTLAELTAATGRTIPDVIAPSLRVLLKDINPGRYPPPSGITLDGRIAFCQRCIAADLRPGS